MTDTYLFVQANSYGINYINKRGLLRCSSEWIGQCHMPGWSEEQTMMTSTLFCLLTSGQDVIRPNPQRGIMTLPTPLNNKKPAKLGTIRQLALFLALLLFSSPSALAYDCCIDGIYYNLNTTDKTASVTYGNSITSIHDYYKGAVTIPETIAYDGTTYAVTSIYASAFTDCHSVTSVTIPTSVTSIDANAFYRCLGLTSVTIPNSVTSIGWYAFGCCSGLESINIPESVTFIGNAAFAGCSGLTSVVVDKNNGTYDSRDNCNAIIETKANKIIAGCKNTIIPNSVTSVGYRAFYGCSGLTSVTIHNTVSFIDGEAFAECSGLTSVIVDKDNNIYDSRDNCNAIIKSSTNSLIVGCKSTIIPNSVISIGGGAFLGCTGLTSVAIPNSVTSIGVWSFGDCTGLTSVTIGNSVTSIDSYAFYRCYGLTSVAIPNSVISIGDWSFWYCRGLTSVSIPNSVTSIGNYAFGYCDELTSVSIPNSVTTIGKCAFEGCFDLTSVIIPNSVTSIEGRAFARCKSLTSVDIGNSVTTIGESAFSDCSGLGELRSHTVVPPTCGYAVFSGIDKETCSLLVPEESIEAYKAADQWKEFVHIIGCSGVDDVSVDTLDAVYEVYNLQGVRVGSGMREAEVTVDALPRGVYILVSPQDCKKLKI